MHDVKPALVLDAMGVIYQAADDVAELLIPFVTGRGGAQDGAAITDAYMKASRGELTAESFWKTVGLTRAEEDEYLSGHRLMPGLLELLASARQTFGAVWCLSNDVSEWSAALRKTFKLEELFDGWVISGDVRYRKPSAPIYEILRTRLGSTDRPVVFVDDRLANLAPARCLGMHTIRFGGERIDSDELHAKDMSELTGRLHSLFG